MDRSVSAHLVCQVQAPARLELQIAVARPVGPGLEEHLDVTLDATRLEVVELATGHGGRLHALDSGPGRLVVTYRAAVRGAAPPDPVGPLDAVHFLRPSRYAESDRLAAVATRELTAQGGAALLAEAEAWVHDRLAYVLGFSSPTDGAVDTLLAGQGACRDQAHLLVALLRARDVPARLVSAYAPGLDPMDFHAVVEALVDGRWLVVDPTRLAPRSALVRIATGRDAADTAFLTNYGGQVDLQEISVLAVTEGDLPRDDHRTATALT